MFNTEILWNKALTDNNVRSITRWLRSLITEGKKRPGQRDVDKSITRFNCWLQSSIELTKKELLTVCFGHCHDLWMFLDQTSFTKLCLLIQKLKNLLILAHWGHTCLICRINTKTLIECGCWNLDLHTLRQHILLGRLVQWWSFSGLLPQYPDANGLKQISRMWQEMNQRHRRTCLDLRCDIEDKYRGSSIIQGMVAHMHKQHGPLWVSEDFIYQTYPPPSLHSLLKIVLVPYTDTTSALAIIMYFVLDMSNMQCKADLLKSFCHTFSIPSSFSKQIYGLWLLDNGFVSNSLGKLLSPGTSSAASCHSYAVLRTLLRLGQRQTALKYLYYTKPAIENIQDARLYLDVLLQNNHVAEARILLEQCLTGDEFHLKHYGCSCENPGFRGKDILHLKLSKRGDSNKPDGIKTRNPGDNVVRNKFVTKVPSSRPFSALLYQCLFNGSLSSGDFLRLFREAVIELNSTKKPTRMVVVWPKYLEKTKDNRHTSQSPEIFIKFPSSPNAVDLQNEEPELHNDRMEVHVSPEVVSSGSTSPHSMDSTCSYICSPSPETSERKREEIKDEEHESLCDRNMSSRAVTQCCSQVTVNTDDSLKAMPIKSLRKESADEPVIFENDVQDVLTDANVSDPADAKVDAKQTEHSSKDEYPVMYCPVIPVDGDNVFIPGFEKMIDDTVQEPHSDSIRAEDECEQCSASSSQSSNCQDSICDEVSGSSSFLDLKPLKRALPYPPVEQSLRSFCYNTQDAMDQPEILTSCAPTETMQDLLDQLEEQNLSLQDGEANQSSFPESVRSSILVIDFNPVRHGCRPHQLQICHEAPLLSFSTGEKTKDKAACEGRKTGIKEVVCFRTTTDRVGDCKLGSWWKQALETRRASTGLLPAIEQVPAVTKEKRHSLVLGWPQSHGLIRGHRQEVKQAMKEETRNRKAKDKGANRSSE